jgi:hypothetical protein
MDTDGCSNPNTHELKILELVTICFKMPPYLFSEMTPEVLFAYFKVFLSTH